MNKIILLILLATTLFSDTLKISATTVSMNYVETDNSCAFLDSETSDYDEIMGLGLKYDMIVGDGFGGGDENSLEFIFDYLNGESIYDGSFQNGTPHTTTSDMEIIDSKIRFAETKKDSLYDVGVFTSLGYRYWVRDIQGIGGYKEIYKWGYFDIGLKALFHEDKWHIGIEGAYQKAFSPEMEAFLNGGLNFDLGDTSGFYYEIPLIYDINQNYSLELSYKYNYWKINRSNIINRGIYNYSEPDSKTKNQIIKIGLVIKW